MPAEQPSDAVELQAAARWVADNVEIECVRDPAANTLHCTATIPSFALSPRDFYELITHPENYEIFRNIQRCTFRKVLWHDRGRDVVEVENESDWQLFVIRGALRTRMIVEQDMARGMMHFALAPGTPSPLREMYGRWEVTAAPGPADGAPRCRVTLYQRFTPRNLPPFLFSAFARLTVRSLRATFEDLVLEAQQIVRGRPTLRPYMAACMRDIVPEGDEGSEATTDAQSVLAALEEASAAPAGSSSDAGSAGSSGAAMAASAASGPTSFEPDWMQVAAEEAGLPWPLPTRGAKGEAPEGVGARVAAAARRARCAWKAAWQWLDDHIPLDDEALESAWSSAFGDDFPRGWWLVVA